MRLLSITAVLLINLFIAVRYTVNIRRGTIKPALAMWVFFSIAVGGSLSTYLSAGSFTFLDNILNSADLFLCIYVAVIIYLFGDKSTRFTGFDRACLIAVLAILGFWLLTRQHATAHSLIQLILVIAYFPVIKRLWNSQENTESFAVWIGLLSAPVFSHNSVISLKSIRVFQRCGLVM